MNLSSYINIESVNNSFKSVNNSFKSYKQAIPFDHCVCDNFFKDEFVKSIFNEIPHYETENFWHEYNNPIEVKKTCNDWNKFKINTYTAFTILNSYEFIEKISELSNIKILEPDHGLNGGGIHIHRNGGKLNYHLDYDMHPKLKKQRKMNIIVYLNPNWKEDFGGELGLFSHDEIKNQPLKLIKSIVPKFNRAIFFDTTQNSWHGLVREVNAANGICRISIAAYYLTQPSEAMTERSKALFAPTENQKNDQNILDLIKKRSGLGTAKNQYIKK